MPIIPKPCHFIYQTVADVGLKVICRYGSVYKIEKWWQAWDDKEPTKQKTDCNNINPERGIVLQRPLQDLKRPDGTYELLEQFNDKGFMNDMPYLQKCVANVDLLVTASSRHKKVLLKSYASNDWNRFCTRTIEPYDLPFYYNFVWAIMESDATYHIRVVCEPEEAGTVTGGAGCYTCSGLAHCGMER